MNFQGIVIIDLFSTIIILLIINLVRTKKLNISYAVVWFLSVLALMTIISVPPLLTLLPLVFGAVYPASALSLLAFILIFLVLIFFSVQLSTISARQIELAQAIAIQELLTRQPEGTAGEDSQQNEQPDDIT